MARVLKKHASKKAPITKRNLRLEPPTPERSRIMSAIRSKGNRSTELLLAKMLRENGISGWRRHLSLPGRPDYVFVKERVAIFVDGCFWHGCPRCYKKPRKNISFWAEKVTTNRERDKRIVRLLRMQSWKVLRIWEHSLVCRGGIAPLNKIVRALGER